MPPAGSPGQTAIQGRAAGVWAFPYPPHTFLEARHTVHICFDARPIRSRMTGIGVYCDRLLRAMVRQGGPDLTWTLPHLPDAPLADLAAGRPGVRLAETRSDYGDHPRGEVWLNAALPALARRHRCDVLHGPAYLIPWVPTRAARIVTIHDLVCFRIPEAFPKRFAWYMRQVIRLSARRADGVIAVSESCARDLVDLVGIERSRIRVIHHGADPRFRPAPDERIAAVRSRHGLDSPYLLYVGTLEPRKGVPAMIATLEALVARGHDVTLALAGQAGWKSEGLIRALETSPAAGRIRRLDYVDDADLPALYAGAGALLYLSLYEGFGLPVLEAMACGCPVVASNRASLPEVTGDAALSVDPEDVPAAVSAVERLLADGDLPADLSRRGLIRAAGFSWDQAADQTVAYYGEVLGKAKKHGP